MKVLLSTALIVLATSLLSASLCAQQKDTASGERLFSSNCAACHGADGRGGERAPNIVTLRNVVSLTDADLEAIVKKGLPGVGMPPFGYLGDQKVSDVVAYLRVLQGKGTVAKVTGNSQAGRALFYGKAECSRCHMMHGEGGFIATDLSAYGNNISAADIRRAIVDPDQHLEPTSTVVEIQTLNGQHISGLLRTEDNFNISLLTEDGRFHMYSKAKLANVRHTTHSIMPKDYGSKLSSKELEDLVSFLITTASAPDPSSRSTKKRANVN
ncbi:MAG: cytochrome c class [Edaphobacter sp.]|nr:cytochrome c class [Edaphobacter sp.]